MDCHHLAIAACVMCVLLHSKFSWLLPCDCFGLSMWLQKLWSNYLQWFLFYGILVTSLCLCYLKTDTSKGYSKTINLRASLYSLGFTLTILLLQVYSLPCVRKCNPPCSWIFGYSFLNHRSLQPSSFALNQCGSFTRMFLPVRCDSATLGASKKCNKCSSESMCSFTLPFTLVFRVLILYRWTAFPFSVPNFLQY